jgi:hypothetical protein
MQGEGLQQGSEILPQALILLFELEAPLLQLFEAQRVEIEPHLANGASEVLDFVRPEYLTLDLPSDRQKADQLGSADHG